MEKNKQTKKCKLNTKLISIAMLAVILVTLLAVPTSAVGEDLNYLVGEWYVPVYTAPGTLNIVREPEITGTFKYYSGGSYYDVSIDSVQLRGRTSSDATTDLTFFGTLNGGTVSATFLPRSTQYKADTIVTGTINSSNSAFAEGRYFSITSVIDTVNVNEQEALYNFLTEFGEKQLPPPPESDPLGNILDVFLGIGGWIATAVTSLIGIFYSAEAGKLTVIGVLSVVSLAISLIFLLIGVIQNFMHFRS